MLSSIVGSLLLSASFCFAQINTYSGGATPTGSAISATGTAEPCAKISSIYASYSAAFPSATEAVRVYASDAYACALSAPLVKEDAVKVVDSLTSILQWQSTLAWLKEPPADYPLAGVDIPGELTDLRNQVDAGDITSELIFQANVTSILARGYDGHLGYQMDAFKIFNYERPFGSLLSLSLDGTDTPKLYLFNDALPWLQGSRVFPSAIRSINGVDAAQFIEQASQNGTATGLQDADALYNSQLWSPNSGAAPVNPNVGWFAVPNDYPGESTTLSFENGTESTKYNTAYTYNNFEEVYDGPSFYLRFCNATEKAKLYPSTPLAPSKVKRQESSSTPAVTKLPEYPPPSFISNDGAFSGYFLTDSGFEDTAVMLMTFMTEEEKESFQSTATEFLDACRTQNKKYLVIDITGNPGGGVILAYDIFKQLFPNLEPYSAGQWRANEALNVLGELITGATQEAQQQQPENFTAWQAVGGDSSFNARFFTNDSGSPFESWSDYYGPVSAHGDEFTNLARWNYPAYAEYPTGEGIGISGYGVSVGAQPFEPENIIIVGDGRCSSTCTILSHLLKWQAKVKSIAIGGRPNTGPMQSQGGVKGSQVLQVNNFINNLGYFSTSLSPEQLSKTRGTALETLLNDAYYALQRGISYVSGPEYFSTSVDLTVNSRNNIREGDSSYVPLQFVYEAADCRLWYSSQYLGVPARMWYDSARTAFGLNGSTAWSMCVEGSTNHPTSLSGNATLFNDGIPTNVTTFITAGTGGDGGDDENGAIRSTSPTSLALLVAMAVALVL